MPSHGSNILWHLEKILGNVTTCGWVGLRPLRVSPRSCRCIWARERIVKLPPGVMPQTRTLVVLWPVIVPPGNRLTSTQVPNFTEPFLKSPTINWVWFSMLSQFRRALGGIKVTYIKCLACSSGEHWSTVSWVPVSSVFTHKRAFYSYNNLMREELLLPTFSRWGNWGRQAWPPSPYSKPQCNTASPKDSQMSTVTVIEISLRVRQTHWREITRMISTDSLWT